MTDRHRWISVARKGKSRREKWGRHRAVPTARIGLAPASAASAAAAPAAATAVAAAAPATTFRFRLGDFHFEPPAIKLAAVQVANSLLGLLDGFHLDKAESSRAARELIGDNVGRNHRPGLGEELTKTVAGGVETQAADEEFLRHGGAS